MKTQDTAGMLEKVRSICLALPEAVEIIDGFGHNTIKINGKSFVISGGERAGIRHIVQVRPGDSRDTAAERVFF